MENYGMVKPSKVSTMSILTLISGIFNILAGVSLSIAAAFTLIGICAIPLTILPSVLGVFEIILASNLMSNPPKPVKSLQVVSILEICGILYGNIFSVVTGILSLVFSNEPEVQEYFQRISM